MEHLNKLLACIKADANLFKNPQINYIVGLTNTQVKELKKCALAQNLIKDDKREFYLTESGENYLKENPIKLWSDEAFSKRPEINLEYLKLDKMPPTLTKAIRCLARNLLEGEELKENSTEHYLVKELLCTKSTCKDVKKDIENFVLGVNPSPQPSPTKGEGVSSRRIKLTCLFEKFMTAPYGLTKSIVAVLLLDTLAKHKDILAIYEQGQFQLRLNQLMFDRMVYCPQNFELQKTVMEDLPILEDISKIILPCGGKSKNILDITKGLINLIRNLDKYTLNTERLTKKTIRFRNAILNAKDPINLFYRDIPRILDDKILCQCGKEFVKSFEKSIDELQGANKKMTDEIQAFFFKAFNSKNRKELTKRFEAVKEYIGDSELKILYNNVIEKKSDDELWINRIATFINKSRVPKDWSDNDVADFKVKIKDLALKFMAIESTAGTAEIKISKEVNAVLNKVLSLTKAEQNVIMRRIIYGYSKLNIC